MDEIHKRAWDTKIIGLRECKSEVERLISVGDAAAGEGDPISANGSYMAALEVLRVMARALGMGCAGSTDGRWDSMRASIEDEAGVSCQGVSDCVMVLHGKGVRGALGTWMKIGDALTGLPPDTRLKEGAQLVFEWVD
jgi:hypothetical protein